MRKKNTNSQFLTIIITLLVAFFCDIKAVNTYFVSGMVEEESQGGPMAMFYMISIVGILAISFYKKKSRIWKDLSKKSVFLLLYLSLFYFFTYSFIGSPYTSVVFFGIFTLCTFFISSVAFINPKIYLKAMMFIAVPTVFKIGEVFKVAYEYSDTISMGLSYSFLIPVVATIVYTFVFFKDESFWNKIIALIGISINFVFAYNILLYGSRGPVLSIVGLILFLMMVKVDSSGRGLILKSGRTLTFSICILYAIVSFIPLLELLHGIFSDYGIKLNFVEKFLRLDSAGDITNGRSRLIDVAINDILDNPLWGLGFDQFNNNHHSLYPHNFIVQIFYDGGLVFFFILLIPLFNSIKRMKKDCTVGELAVLTTLFFASVPGALFSGDLWQNGILWMLFGAIISRNFVLDTKTDYE